jgi:hypothetical protein
MQTILRNPPAVAICMWDEFKEENEQGMMLTVMPTASPLVKHVTRGLGLDGVAMDC